MKTCSICGKPGTLFIRTDQLRCLRCHAIAAAMTQRNETQGDVRDHE